MLARMQTLDDRTGAAGDGNVLGFIDENDDHRPPPRFLARLEPRLHVELPARTGPDADTAGRPASLGQRSCRLSDRRSETASFTGAKGGIDRADEPVRRVEPGRRRPDHGPVGGGLPLSFVSPRRSRGRRWSGRGRPVGPLRDQGGALLRQSTLARAGRALADVGLPADLLLGHEVQGVRKARQLLPPAGEERRPPPFRAIGSSQERIELVHVLEALPAGIAAPTPHGIGGMRLTRKRGRDRRLAPQPLRAESARARAYCARQVSTLSWVQTSRPV